MRPASRSAWRNPILWVGLSIPLLLLLYVGLLAATLPEKPGREVSYTDMVRRMEEKRVESAVLLGHDDVFVFTSEGQELRSVLPDAAPEVLQDILEVVRANGVPLRIKQQPVKNLLQPATMILPAMIILAAVLLTFLLTRTERGRFKPTAAGRATQQPVTFADVAGNDEVVAEVREVRDYLRHPERLAAIGAEAPRGILLVGPPGTGKTLLARAIAGEAGVPFFSASGTEFVEMYQGVGAARVRELFRLVRQNAPAILFLDELDAVGRTRAGTTTSGQEERDQTLNQLLVEMDGFDRFGAVVLMGATNRPDVLDPALLRRGRFDRQIVVDRPDRAGRAAILRVHARGKRLDSSVNLDALAAQTPGLTGADLASAMNEAALIAARRGKPAIGSSELEEAVDRVIAGNERARVLTVEEKRAVAYHEAGHALVAWALPGTDPITKISIISRGQALGLTWMVPEEERYLVTRTELESRMAVAMGGMAAEQLVLGETTSGPKDDLRHATRLARQMVCELGMSEQLGRLAWGQVVAGQFLGDDVHQADYSDEVAAEIDREMRRVTDAAFSRATEVLVHNEDLLDTVATSLVERETLRGPELATYASATVDPRRQPAGDGARRGRVAARPPRGGVASRLR